MVEICYDSASVITKPPRDILIGFILAIVMGAGLAPSRLSDPVNNALLDRQFALLRKFAPEPLSHDVVLIGIDENAYVTLPEPFALWHHRLGKLFAALAEAKPAIVGLDIPLPVRSYDFMAPGYDRALLDGARRLAAVSPIVLGQHLSGPQRFRPIFPELLKIPGVTEPVSLTLCPDKDDVVRRFALNRCAEIRENTILIGAMARRLGVAAPAEGLIDYSVGAKLTYLPLLDILSWIERDDHARLNKAFAGRIVLVGTLLPSDPRFKVPVPIAAWEPESKTLPGVVVQAQGLRSMLARGMVQPVGKFEVALLSMVAALFWLFRNNRWKVVAFVVFVLGIPAIATLALWHGVFVPAGTLTLAGAIAFAARLAWEGLRHYHEKKLLRTAFAGHVSPSMMREILRGGLESNRNGERRYVAVLFADIRNFTTRSESTPPDEIIALLNHYFSEMAAAIHTHGGVIDKFIGDGIMAAFGAPKPLPHPERSALEAAHDMLVRLERINRDLLARNIEPLAIGIGIHCGEALAGYVGSRKRRDYTLMGDVVNAASRIEGLTKPLGYPILCSEPVAAAVHFRDGMADLGLQTLKGHTPLHLFGWRPSLLDRLAAQQPPA